MDLLEFVGIAKHAQSMAEAMSYGQRKLLELAYVLIADPEIVLLDEPAGALGVGDVVVVGDGLAADRLDLGDDLLGRCGIGAGPVVGATNVVDDDLGAFGSEQEGVLPPEPAPRRSWLQKLRKGLSRSSGALTEQIAAVFTKRKLDGQALEELEDMLIRADLGADMVAQPAVPLVAADADLDAALGQLLDTRNELPRILLGGRPGTPGRPVGPGRLRAGPGMAREPGAAVSFTEIPEPASPAADGPGDEEPGPGDL